MPYFQATSPGSAAQVGNEVCPSCSARFNSVTELIEHVDAIHTGGHLQAATQDMERCPHCSTLFPDAVALVQHVEQHHSNKPTCVLC